RAGYGDSGGGFVGVDAIAAGNGIDGRYPGRVLVITAATSTATTITATATATATTAATARGGGEAERADAGEDRAGAGACGSALLGGRGARLGSHGRVIHHRGAVGGH